MASNLKDRLKRIRENRAGGKAAERAAPPAARGETAPPGGGIPGWESAGYQCLRRIVATGTQVTLSEPPPAAAPLLIPDLYRYRDAAGRLPRPEELLFFDLETTGLSGGAGTAAFLAAFGMLKEITTNHASSAAPNCNHANGKVTCQLSVEQFLLLDYPGEPDFLERVLGVLNAAAGKNGLLVSFNGKTFDTQILKNRCLINGLMPPELFHADLLHPARRLWKNTLESCSQAMIETEILGLDRSGDVGGAFAPDIWFAYLRRGDTAPDEAAAAERSLIAICDHNVRDIQGLACLYAALTGIAADPLASIDRYRCGAEALALRWRRPNRGPDDPRDHDTAAALLAAAAEQGSVKAALCMAMDAEWKTRDYAAALALTERLSVREDLAPPLREDLTRRRERLLRKAGSTPQLPYQQQ